jgi:hypothetical protein
VSADRAPNHLVRIRRKLFGALAVVVALSLSATMQISSSASTVASSKSLLKDLLPSSYAKTAGFTKVVAKATTTSKTGVKTCPDGGQEAFENASGETGLVSEVLACTTSKAALVLLSGTRSATSASSANPPKRLGPSAMERSSNGSTYAIYWRRGTIVEVVALITNVPASNSSSTSTTVAAPPITSAQQTLLSRAAVEQDALFR